MKSQPEGVVAKRETCKIENTGPHNEASVALLHVLPRLVTFVRFMGMDLYGNVRCKTIPAKFLSRHPDRLSRGVEIAKACIGGIPSYGDVIVRESGWNAVGSFHLTPSLSTLRILPYASNSAVVLGNFEDWCPEDPSLRFTVNPFCARSLLQRVVIEARRNNNLHFGIGAEIEFCLYNDGKPVETSNFADVTLLNKQHDFFQTLHDHLSQQDISVECVHSESANGQAEVVLEYIHDDPVAMMDYVLLARQTISAVAQNLGLKALFPKTRLDRSGEWLPSPYFSQ